MKTIRVVAALALCALAAAGAAAQDLSAYVVSTRVDWFSQKLVVDISLDLAKAGLRMPAARSEAGLAVTRDLADLARGGVFSLLVDSYRDVGQTTSDGTISVDDLLGFLNKGARTGARFSSDFASYRATYEFPLTRLSELFVRHTVPHEPPPSLRFVPTKRYTGVVIYAAGEYPVQGEHVDARLVPALFPRIYDETMSLVLERNMMDPAAIRRWGLVAYASDLSDPSLESRVGDDPLRIMAYRVFGTNRTDIVITEEDALKILNLADNRALLREGRVVVVLDAAE